MFFFCIRGCLGAIICIFAVLGDVWKLNSAFFVVLGAVWL